LLNHHAARKNSSRKGDLHSFAGQADRDRLAFGLLSDIYFAPLRLCEGFSSPPNAREFSTAAAEAGGDPMYYLVMTAFFALILAGAVMVNEGSRPRRKGDWPHCRQCEYLLIGIQSERCPECGTPLIPGNILRGERGRPSGLAMAGVVAMLLGVVLLLAVISGEAIRGDPLRARISAASTDAMNLKVALDAFQGDCGRYPTTAEGLNALATAPPGVRTWRGPYVDKVPIDPWGNPYVYRCPGSNGKDYHLFCCGPDGIPGTSDDIGN
jgi:general secretion pathway protein G